LKDLIQKYLTNSITKEEALELQEWLSNKDNEIVFKNLIKEKHQIDTIYNSNIDIESALEKVHQKITPTNKVIVFYKPFLKYVAILVILLGIIFVFNQKNTDEKEMIFDYSSHVILEINSHKKYNLSSNSNQVIKNKKGQIIASVKEGQLVYNTKISSSSHHLISVPNTVVYNVILTDGTNVTINSGSSLKYQSNFLNNKNRKVYLKGEAFFDVTKNKNAPFIVTTKKLNIKVLGTKFNVSSYNNDKNTSVVLEEGSVSINEKSTYKNKSVILNPKEQFVLENNKFIVKKAIVEKHIAWKKRKLHFSNDQFEDIIKEMERYYNIKINLSSSTLNEKRFTGTFTTETIEDVLNVFKEFSEFSYTREANIISIYNAK
jgi:hypothetical protein